MDILFLPGGCLDFVAQYGLEPLRWHLNHTPFGTSSLFDGCDGDISIRIRYFVDLGANLQLLFVQ
jgi:hypothetical protein